MDRVESEDGPPPPPKIAFQPQSSEKGGAGSSEDKGSLLSEALDLAEYSYSVPATVYGVAMMSGVLFETDTFVEWFTKCGESYLRCGMNLLVQVGLMLCVFQIDVWQQDTIDNGIKDGSSCYNLTPFFFGINLWIFCCVVLTEIFETFDMYEIVLRRIPTVPGHSELLRYTTGEGDPQLQSGGMSVRRKACLCFFVLGPKLGLGITMLVVGGNFLKHSASNTDLLMNSLAAVFILDMDEIIYSFMTPGHARRLLEGLPAFTAAPNLLYDTGRKTAFLWKLLLSSVLVVIFNQTRLVCRNNPCDGAIRTCPAFDFPGFRRYSP